MLPSLHHPTSSGVLTCVTVQLYATAHRSLRCSNEHLYTFIFALLRYNKAIMLKLSGSLLNQPVVSLRTGGTIARTESAIINPHNLKIEGFYCLDSRSRQQLILLVQDIRDTIAAGIVVDDYDVLSEPNELVRLKKVLDLEYELHGKPVQTVKKHRLGKVSDYACDDQAFFIQKLYVERSLLKSLSSDQLAVDRTEIVEVTDKRVIIKEIQKTVKAGLPAPAPAV